MSNLRAEQIYIEPLNCSSAGKVCPMTYRGFICGVVANKMLSAATKEDPTYEPERRLSSSTEAMLLTDHMKLGPLVLAAGRAACLERQAFYNRTAAESPLSIMT